MSNAPLCTVIGAGPGMGLAISRRFAQAGFDLIMFSRRGAEREAAALRAEGFTAEGRALDAADPESVAAALEAAGPVQVLVYNATAARQAAPMALTPEQLQQDLTVSVGSALAAAQAVAPGMIARSGGSILLTGGGFAHRPMAALASLGIGKAALRNLAFSLAEELQPQGVRVGTVTILGMVAPGTKMDPAAIAEAFYALHEDREATLGIETGFSGAAP